MGPADSFKVTQNGRRQYPMGFQHRVDDQIHVVIVKPLGFAQNTFLNEAKAFGHSPAFEVAEGAMQDDAIAGLLGESVIGEESGRLCHNSAALMGRVEPIAELGSSIQ